MSKRTQSVASQNHDQRVDTAVGVICQGHDLINLSIRITLELLTQGGHSIPVNVGDHNSVDPGIPTRKPGHFRAVIAFSSGAV